MGNAALATAAVLLIALGWMLGRWAEVWLERWADRRRHPSDLCRRKGCDMQHRGGANAGCGSRDCGCSVPVYECTRCGDSDYGVNDEATEIRARCAAEMEDL